VSKLSEFFNFSYRDMNQILTRVALFWLLIFIVPAVFAQNQPDFKAYKDQQQMQAFLKTMQSRNPQVMALHTIAQSPGGSDITVIEIGKNLTDGPAIFVSANFEGINPLSTEGALFLMQFLLDSAQYRSNVKWYILPVGNPDAAQNFFAKPRLKSTLNAMPVNIDVDDQTNEDGYEDLNNDGYITMMRKNAPDGDYRISDEDPRLMVKADPVKGERGIFKLYTEGIDNDGDGLFNEDEPGGVNPGINFPHDFQHFNKEAGLWPGYAPETYGVMKFIYDHPEIVMTVTLGESNFLLDIPQEGRLDFDPNRIRIPERFARQTGLAPTQTYTMEQLIQSLSARFPDAEVTENMVLSNLNLGPEKNFRKNDLPVYESLAKAYKAVLSANNISTSRMAPEKPRSGSFELWSYFHLGVPSIALNLWAPEVKRDTASVSQTAGSASRRPGDNNAEKKPSPEKQMLDYFDKNNIKGFADWQPFNHPQLGEVEIGGFIPFASNTPPAEQIESLLKGQIPFVASLSKKIHNIEIVEEKITSLGAGIYRVELFVENKGEFSFPTDMGQRNQQPAPVVLILEGNDIQLFEGLRRTPVHAIGANQVRKLTWMVKTSKPGDITAKLESPVIRNQVRKINIGK
jgi:hypothetical protein